MRRITKCELNIKLSENSEETTLEVVFQGKPNDFRQIAERLSETQKGRAVLAIMATMAEYAKQIA